MMMLFHSSAPKHFWVEAFVIVGTFLVNYLPSRTLDFQSPFSTLFSTFPDYHSLSIFSSKCYPYTWDTKENKFYPKTLPCIFLVYSDCHCEYKCYHHSEHPMFTWSRIGIHKPNPKYFKIVFLHGDLKESIYMEQPIGFIHNTLSSHVCKLNKALYGIKQAP